MSLDLQCNTQIPYTGDGSTTTFKIDFDIYNEAHVYVAWWSGTANEWVTRPSNDLDFGYTVDEGTNESFVIFNTAPENGQKILIYRLTPVDEMRVDFEPGRPIKAQDLDDNFNQLADAIEDTRCVIEGFLDDDLDPDDIYWKKAGETLYSGHQWESSDCFIASTAALEKRIRALITISETAPPTPNYPGELWWNSEIADLFIYYYDGDSYQWVSANNSIGEAPSDGVIYGRRDKEWVEINAPSLVGTLEAVTTNGNTTGSNSIIVGSSSSPKITLANDGTGTFTGHVILPGGGGDEAAMQKQEITSLDVSTFNNDANYLTAVDLPSTPTLEVVTSAGNNTTKNITLGPTTPTAQNPTTISLYATGKAEFGSNVSIGTTDPQHNLEVEDTVTPTIALQCPSNKNNPRAGRIIYSFSDGDGASINATRPSNKDASDVTLSFRTGGTTNAEERVLIDSTGNVGIGTSNPDSLLHLKGPASDTGYSDIDLKFEVGSKYGGVVSGYVDQGKTHGLIFSSLDNGTTTEQVRITNDGKLEAQYFYSSDDEASNYFAGPIQLSGINFSHSSSGDAINQRGIYYSTVLKAPLLVNHAEENNQSNLYGLRLRTMMKGGTSSNQYDVDAIFNIESEVFNSGQNADLWGNALNITHFRATDIAAKHFNTGTQTNPKGFGFVSNITDYSGVGINSYNFYAEGDAPNFFAGNTYIGGTTAQNANIDLIADDGIVQLKGLSFNKGATTADKIDYNGFFFSDYYKCPLLLASLQSDDRTSVTGLRLIPYAYYPEGNQNKNLTNCTGLSIDSPTVQQGSNADSTIGNIKSLHILGHDPVKLPENGVSYNIHSYQAAVSSQQQALGKTQYNFYAAGDAPNYLRGYIVQGPYLGWDGTPGNLQPWVDTWVTDDTHDCALINSGITISRYKSTADYAFSLLTTNLRGANASHITFKRNGAIEGSIRSINGGVTYATDANGTPAFVELGDARNRTYTDFSGNAVDTLKLLQPKVNGFNPAQLQSVVANAVTGTENATEAIGTLADYDGTVLETEVTEPSDLTYTEDVTDSEGVTTQAVLTRTWTATGTRPVYQGVDQTKLIPLLTKALQEALERIEQLEADHATLMNGGNNNGY